MLFIPLQRNGTNTKYMILLMVIPFFASYSIEESNIFYKRIENIGEILSYVPKTGNRVALIDWDETISKEEGGHEFRESGPKGTSATLCELHQIGISTAVLTSRKCNVPVEKLSHSNDISNAEASVRRMLATLGESWCGNGALKSGSLQRITTQDLNVGSLLTIFTYKHIIYTGGKIRKGAVATTLVDQNKFKMKPDHIIFVENEESEAQIFGKFFENRKEQVYVFYYPKL